MSEDERKVQVFGFITTQWSTNFTSSGLLTACVRLADKVNGLFNSDKGLKTRVWNF